ncbi:MAG: DUF1326 domain-containing protein [Planctomycetes bacterium]|nr:DUF1326 domain-containing protein [Planctomycetota bacterium]
MAVYIEKGNVGGTDMSGATWVITVRGAAEDTSTNWSHLYVSDKMTDAQIKVVTGMLEEEAKKLGPKAAYLFGKGAGMRKVPITYTVSADKKEWSATIPGILDLRVKALVPPGRSEPARSVGILDDFGDTIIHGQAIAHTYNDPQIGYSWDLTDRQSNWAPFHIGDFTTAKIGWGCWTPHADLGDTSKYPEQKGGEDPKPK